MQEKHIKELKEDNEVRIKAYEKDLQNNLDSVQNLYSNNATFSSEVDALQNAISSKLEVETKLKTITKIESQIETLLSKHKRDISFFQHNDDCPTCRQAIALGFKQEELNTLHAKSEECREALKKVESKIINQQNKLNEINDKQKKIQQLQIQIATTNTSITETNKYIDKLKIQVRELKESKVVTDREQSDLKELKDRLSGLEEELKELIQDKAYYEVASGLLKDTGIKTKIIRQYLPIINKLVNKYLASLDFFVNFNLDESFKETIKSRHRDDFSYNNFSEGEKQRIDMALMLTWRAIAKLKNSSNTNLLILDEVFDSSLDTNGTEELMKILHMLEDVNLYVISHKGDILQDKFSNVIRFEKVKNFSRIVK